MNVLVFGGTGFLGKNLVNYLLEKGHTVGLYVRPQSQKENFVVMKRDMVRLHIGDFQAEDRFESMIKGYDAVYHLISETVPGVIDPLRDIETTIKPSLRLLEACVKENIKKFIFFSSGGTVYGIPEKVPLTEENVGQPISSYGIQKQVLERYLRFYNYNYGLPIIILRISNPYGRYQKPFRNQGVIANLLGRYLTHKTIEIWGGGEAVRDYVYVNDMIIAAEKALGYKGCEQIFNIGSGEGKTVNEIIQIIDEIVGGTLQVEYRPGRKTDVPINVLDISKAEKELGWRPCVSLKAGISQMLGFWNEKNINFDG